MTATVAIVGAWMLGAYIAGSIPFGWIIGKMSGVDIRLHGSKNIGATNCGRVCGWPFGIAAFVLDVAKGFLPVGLAWVRFLWLPSVDPPGPNSPATIPDGLESCQLRLLVVVLVGLAALLGHTFPVWLKFKGGKAVATALGVVLALPILLVPALAAFGIWIVVTAATRYVSVGSTVAALTLAGVDLWIDRDEAWGAHLPATVFVLLVAVMVLVRHRSNYGRLLRGTENKLWGRKDGPAARPR
jgi:acyl phosphate:glycerol-3-phosphate acyltransferase